MVLKIETTVEGQFRILRLSGRLEAEQLEQLKAQIEANGPKVALDLEDVKLVDQDSVSFLATCEANGVQLRQCSHYIRSWITREKSR
jgi:anti-anti-sigma regulatory factor